MAIADRFIQYLSLRDELSRAEIERLSALPTERRSFAPGEVIVAAGENTGHSCVILSGMASRVHELNGPTPRRVVTQVYVPGDFADLQAFVLGALDSALVSNGPSEVEFVRHAELTDITLHFPHLARLLWMFTGIDAAIVRQWLVASNSLRSSAHLAHFLCEIYTRLASVGAAADHRMRLPMLQRELADALGYSPIHVNRAVGELRERGLVRWTGFQIDILDWAGLARLARFDPVYLDLERRPR